MKLKKNQEIKKKKSVEIICKENLVNLEECLMKYCIFALFKFWFSKVYKILSKISCFLNDKIKN